VCIPQKRRIIEKRQPPLEVGQSLADFQNSIFPPFNILVRSSNQNFNFLYAREDPLHHPSLRRPLAAAISSHR